MYIYIERERERERKKERKKDRKKKREPRLFYYLPIDIEWKDIFIDAFSQVKHF